MISEAIYNLLSDASITSLVTGGVYPIVAPQDANFPFVVWNETQTPELNKDGRDVDHYDLNIDVYCAKGKDGNGGLLEAQAIADAIIAHIEYYSGTTGGSSIQTIVLESQETMYDPISEAARVVIDFRVRINN